MWVAVMRVIIYYIVFMQVKKLTLQRLMKEEASIEK